MKISKRSFMLALAIALSGCSSETVKKVTFTLHHEQKPFSNEEIAVFPVEGEEISVTPDNLLGTGRTDEQGKVTIEFKSPDKYSRYVLLGGSKDVYMLLRNEGRALTFQCDVPVCNLGDLVVETFEFSMRRRGAS